MKLAIPDLISNSYFPAIAAVELGCFAREGLDVELEMVVPVETAFERMKAGSLHLLGASAHLMVGGFPEWRGVRMICAQSQGMYWYLVCRADLGIARGDLSALKDMRVGAAPWVAMGLRHVLRHAGIDAAARGIAIAPIPGAHGAGINFGVTAAAALESGKVDAFWANGMGAELAVKRGVGTIVLDARRDLPAAVTACTQPIVAATTDFLAAHPRAAAACTRALAAAHGALKADVSRAARIGAKLFPAEEAGLIVDLIRRDLPFYDTELSPGFVTAMLQFSRDAGILTGAPAYADIVAIR